MNITTKAMLIRFSAQQWSARKLDRKATKEVADKHNTTTDAGRYNKNLLAGFDAPLVAIAKTVNAARTYHYENTLPWSDDGGARILPSAHYLDYCANMRAHRAKFDAAVNAFCEQYPQLKESARVTLNGLFNPSEYPDTEAIRRKFGFDFSVMPLPDAGDFRVTLSDDEVARVRADIEDRANKAIADAMRDLWQRLYECVQAMRDKLSTQDAVFRDSLVQNLRDLCALLPKLNLTNDSTLDELRTQAERDLCDFEPQTLRNDMHARQLVADKAAQMMSIMSAYMGGPAK